MLSRAAQLQQSAEQYELIIADFLRAQAIASSAKTNYQDLLRILSVTADEKTLSLLAQAERSALTFYAQPRPESQLELESATQALQNIDLNPERVKELQVQVRLLLENVSISQV